MLGEDVGSESYAAPTPDADGSDVQLVEGGYVDLDSVALADTLGLAAPPVVSVPPSTTDGGEHVLSVTVLRRLSPIDPNDTPFPVSPHLLSRC